MKNIYSNIKTVLLISVIILGMGSCSSEDFSTPKEADIPLAVDYEDAIKMSVDQSTNYVTLTFEGKGVTPVWIIDGKYSTEHSIKKYYRKAGDYSIDVKIANANGISDGVLTKTFHIDKTIINGFGGFVYDSDFNLWKKAIVSKPKFYYAPGWSQIADPIYTFEGSTYSINLPEATTDLWQSQVLIGSNINTSVGTKYDFSVILSSTTDNPNVTVKLVDGSDDNIFYFSKVEQLTANEPLCSYMSGMEGLNITNLKLVIDFGGNETNTEVTIEDIVFKDHANDDGTIVPEVIPEVDINWVDVDSPENLWHGVKFTNMFNYAVNGTSLPDPVLNINGIVYTAEFPTATTEAWQNQIMFITSNIATAAEEEYDFRVVLNSSSDIDVAKIKLEQDGDNSTFIFYQEVDLKAGKDLIVKIIGKPGKNLSKPKLIFDFGGNLANTTVTIKDIILQKHKD